MSRDNYKYLIFRNINITNDYDDSSYCKYIPIVICDTKAQANQYIKYLLKFLDEIYNKIPKWSEDWPNDGCLSDDFDDDIEKRKKYLDKVIWPLAHNMSDIFDIYDNEKLQNDSLFSINKVKYVMKN